MKEKYKNLTEFIQDILEAAEEAQKNIVEDLKEKEEKPKCEEKPRTEKFEDPYLRPKTTDFCPNYKKEPDILPVTVRTNDENNYFILNEMIDDWPTHQEQHLIFEHIEDGYKVPGITESQLLAVLYYRFIHNPKKLDLVRQLMN